MMIRKLSALLLAVILLAAPALGDIRYPAQLMRIIAASGANTTVANTVTETSLFSVSVPAGMMDLTNCIRATIIGSYARAVSETITVRFKYGATTVATSTSGDATSAAMPFSFEALLCADDSATAQAGALTPAGLTGALLSGGTAAENSGTALTLDVTVQHSVADAGNTISKTFVLLELLVRS